MAEKNIINKKTKAENVRKENVSQKVIEKIKDRKIKPKPKWEFLLKDYFLWFFGIISLVVGAFASSVTIYMFASNDWDVYRHINDSFFGFVLATLPYFWIICLACFILVARYNFQHTKKGYRHRLHLIIIGSIVVSILLGAFLYSIGIGQVIDDALSEKLPFYGKLINKRKMIWMRPEKGLLAGVITSLDDYRHFWLQDFDDKNWHINGEGAIMMRQVEIKKDSKIKVMGEKLNANNFRAHRIAPWNRGKITPWILKTRPLKNYGQIRLREIK